MSITARIGLTVALVFVMAFCGFGFLVSLEPGGWRLYRLLYAVVGVVCIAAVAVTWLPRRPRP